MRLIFLNQYKIASILSFWNLRIVFLSNEALVSFADVGTFVLTDTNGRANDFLKTFSSPVSSKRTPSKLNTYCEVAPLTIMVYCFISLSIGMCFLLLLFSSPVCSRTFPDIIIRIIIRIVIVSETRISGKSD